MFEKIKDWDNADATTPMTRKNVDDIAKKNCTFCTPPPTYAELKDMITNFCALLWFGERAPIYRGVQLISTMLTTPLFALQQFKYAGILSKETM